jgi:cyclophilin family peptidyl-prolyl cis-trans isomerase
MSSKPTSRLRRGSAAVLLFLIAGCGPGASVYENPPLPDDAPRVVIETSHGDIVVGLYAEQAPITVNNFLAYVDAGFYDGTVFHRVLPGFMAQGGGFVHQGDQYLPKQTRPPIELESDVGLKNVRGSVAMARRDIPLASATSQFFINLVDNQRLDRLGDVNPGYAVFGTVIEGMDVVDSIAAVETGMRPPFPEPATPVEDVVIRSIRRQAP